MLIIHLLGLSDLDLFHSAWFCERAFRFLEPELEGRFRTIDLGCLILAGTGEPLPWEPAFSGLRAVIDWDLYRMKIAEKGAAGKYP